MNNGKCLQQWAYAARWATVACVRRMMERVGTCLETKLLVCVQNYKEGLGSLEVDSMQTGPRMKAGE